MPMFGTPVVASLSEVARPARLPEPVKAAITSMVEEGLCFASAGQRHGVSAQRMRRWLGRREAVAFLRKTRAQFRVAACAANEAYLVTIRSGENSMAAVNAIKVLEQISDNEVARPSNSPGPGVTIVIREARPEPINITAKVIAGD